MKYFKLLSCVFVLAVALTQAVQAASITVNGLVTAELAPPAGSFKSDTESGDRSRVPR